MTDQIILPYTILIDQNEGLPYTFENIRSIKLIGGVYPAMVVKTKICYLKTADYSIDGYEDKVAIERKTLSDLYGTLGGGRDRFEREMCRLVEFQYGAIVVEADLSDVMKPTRKDPDFKSQLSPRSVFGTYVSWSIKYDISWIFAGNRRNAEYTTFHLLRKFTEEMPDNKGDVPF